MASQDFAQFTSSDQIFAAVHTLPQIRSIHKGLHVQIEEKSTRLRTQVGSSYRELLGTADTIVHMRGDNDRVQELLGKMGGRCGRAVIERKATGLSTFVAAEDKLAASVTARLKLLDACLLNAERILRGGGGLDTQAKRGDRLVLVAKILVLSRLLVKSLSENETAGRTRRELEATKVSWENLRRRLSNAFDKVLQRASDTVDREDVLKSLCSYSLTNSSGATDVLRHLLSVRSNAMIVAFEVEASERERSASDVIHGLRLYTKTLLDVQALVPVKLSTGLSSLKSRPLLADPTLKQLEGLRLDVYEHWCSEEIQYYTPFIQHDDLNGAQAREMLSSWSDKGAKVLLEGLKKTLEQMTEFKMIIDLRTKVLELWIRDGGKIKGIDPADMQNQLRDAINSRMLAVLDLKVNKLRLVGSEITATLGKWKDGITDEHVSLWDEEGYEATFSGGAAPLVQEVVSRLYGRNDAVSKADNSYKVWYRVIDDVKEVVESLRRQRWDNDYDEIEDEETIEERQQLLSKDDPKLLQDRLDTALDRSFEELHRHVEELWKERSDAPNSSAVAMYFLRVVRDIRHQLPQRPAIKNFGLSIVPLLHSRVASSISDPSLDDFAATGLALRKPVGRPLWDGEPSLPSQPSPEVFQLLRQLSLSMSTSGMDLWTPTASAALKAHLSQRLCSMWLEALKQVDGDKREETKPQDESKSEGENSKRKTKGKKAQKESEEEAKEDEEKAEGDEPQDATDEVADAEKETPTDVANEGPAGLSEDDAADLMTQWLFDVALLQRFISGEGETAKKEFKTVEDAIYQRARVEESTVGQRISKSSQEFWQRTHVLFGMFA